MSMPPKGAIAQLFDLVVHYPSDAAFGFYAPPEKPVDRAVEVGLVGVSAGLMVAAGVSNFAAIGVPILAFPVLYLSADWAAYGRAARHAVDFAPR